MMNPEFGELMLFSLTPGDALVSLGVALACGILIATLYRITYSGISYSGGYVTSLIMLTLITTLVIMVIGDNLARAFGLVGAMSIIRFRTAVKDAQDIMFIFFALAVGLASGAGMYMIAITCTVAIGAVIYVVSLVNRGTPWKPEYLIEMAISNEQAREPEVRALLSRYCSKQKLINIKGSHEGGTSVSEYSYYVVFRKTDRAAELSSELQKLAGVTRVNVFFDET